nr:hypothetical protein [Fusobacterium gastrosuis]
MTHRDIFFKPGEIKKIENLIMPVTEEAERATENISKIIASFNILATDKNLKLIKELKKNIEEIRKSYYVSGIFKGLELERLGIINWCYDDENKIIEIDRR